MGWLAMHGLAMHNPLQLQGIGCRALNVQIHLAFDYISSYSDISFPTRVQLRPPALVAS